jgi:hypothetical protein
MVDLDIESLDINGSKMDFSHEPDYFIDHDLLSDGCTIGLAKDLIVKLKAKRRQDVISITEQISTEVDTASNNLDMSVRVYDEEAGNSEELIVRNDKGKVCAQCKKCLLYFEKIYGLRAQRKSCKGPKSPRSPGSGPT